MPRSPRVVIPEVPHHVVQRGHRKQPVFFDESDRWALIGDLHKHSLQFECQILAYCLMSNHIHLIIVPPKMDSLAKLMHVVHTKHAKRINKKNDWCGHVWQNRYFSCVLDESHFWAAVRYVELNPVRAQMVEHAEKYFWSSARFHCSNRTDKLLQTSADSSWNEILPGASQWRKYLRSGEYDLELTAIRSATTKNQALKSIKKVPRTTSKGTFLSTAL